MCKVTVSRMRERYAHVVEWKRYVMAHAQKPDLVFQRNGRVHLYRQGCQISRLLAAEVCASAVVMLDRPCSHTVHECWLPTPITSFPFTSPPVLRRVPSDSVSTLLTFWITDVFCIMVNHYSKTKEMWTTQSSIKSGISKCEGRHSNCTKSKQPPWLRSFVAASLRIVFFWGMMPTMGNDFRIFWHHNIILKSITQWQGIIFHNNRIPRDGHHAN